MGPIRTDKRHKFKAGESSSSFPKTTRKHKHTGPDSSSAKSPGIQKLKASLRQTRRLLAKDTLAADVRVETERRLKALEADIAQAEVGRKERGMAVRYHKVKFFERQKVIRKINQTKKQLSTTNSSRTKAEAEATLYALRVDLNYILHYPKSKKYISLFPSSFSATSDTPKTDTTAKTESDDQRDRIRAWVRERIESGEFSGEPEVSVLLGSDLGLDGRAGASGRGIGEWEEETKTGRKKREKPKEGVAARGGGGGGVEADAFFESESDGDGHEGGDGSEDENGSG